MIYNNYIIYIYKYIYIHMFQEDAEKDGNDEMENMAADDSEDMQSVEDSVPQARERKRKCRAPSGAATAGNERDSVLLTLL